jgi:ATP-dependent Zn protease
MISIEMHIYFYLQGHTAGQNPAVEIDNVQIGKERISFRVKQDEEKHTIALQHKSLVANKDVAVKTIEPREVFVTKVNADQQLMDSLRQNDIPFRAMSTKSSQTAALAARSGIALFYIFFLLRMYRAISQQGGGGGKGDTPGKLAKESELALVKFNEIEGIDKAKYEVMELVDTLRNPEKYTLVGARPPTGLLLVGPPVSETTLPQYILYTLRLAAVLYGCAVTCLDLRLRSTFDFFFCAAGNG